MSEVERRFLASPPRVLARIATVDPRGMPHVVPVGWSYDAAAHEIVLGGREVAATERARHVRATGVAAVVIDGLADGAGWSPWAFGVRGRAGLADRENVVRLSCDELISWGLEALLTSHH